MKMWKIWVMGILIFLANQNIFADGFSCPEYEFTRNLVQGSIGEDVRLLQKILNADKRTIISLKGVGSPGSESPTFGRATRESLKRFQALFIEYVGVADGKLNEKTRTSLNAVCKGPYFTNGGKGSPYDLKDKIPPIIAIAGPTNFDIGSPFRAYLAATEAIKTPSLTSLILAGATIGDMRKISSTTYSFLVTPNEDVQDIITLQVEADTIKDLGDNKNDRASNEWVIVKNLFAASSTASNTLDLSLFDLPSLLGGTSTDKCANVKSVSVYDYSNPCYGKVPIVSDPSQNQQPQQDPQKPDSGGADIMQMLSGLLQGLMKAAGGAGGGQEAGGKGTPSGTCVCPGPAAGHRTGVLAGIKGPSGGTDMQLCPGAGSYVGKALPPPPICGQAFIKGKCINERADSNGVILTSSVSPCGAGGWQWSF